jgi:uncharacterized protein YfiM (DUF2279 family)
MVSIQRSANNSIYKTEIRNALFENLCYLIGRNNESNDRTLFSGRPATPSPSQILVEQFRADGGDLQQHNRCEAAARRGGSALATSSGSAEERARDTGLTQSHRGGAGRTRWDDRRAGHGVPNRRQLRSDGPRHRLRDIKQQKHTSAYKEIDNIPQPVNCLMDR